MSPKIEVGYNAPDYGDDQGGYVLVVNGALLAPGFRDIDDASMVAVWLQHFFRSPLGLALLELHQLHQELTASRDIARVVSRFSTTRLSHQRHQEIVKFDIVSAQRRYEVALCAARSDLIVAEAFTEAQAAVADVGTE